MFKRIKSIIFVISAVMVFTAQTYRLDDKGKQGAPVAKLVPVAHNNQSRSQVPTRREAPAPVVHRQATMQPHLQPAHQERKAPLVHAVVAPAPVGNNRFLNRQHHNHWQPRYNFYDNQYHFYPYVNIASIVELSGGYVVVGPDGQNYYYDQGTFYLQDQAGQYVAVAPPVGIIVNPIAAGARQIIVNNQLFYRYKGIFYIQIAQGYQVVGPVQSDSDG